jgi:low affinity Fe/Cu permease
VHKDALRDSIDTDYKADQAEAASRAESDEYPLRPAGDERS